MALTPFGSGWPFAPHRHRESIFDSIDASWNRSFLLDDFFRLPFFSDDLFPFPSPFCTSSSSSSALADWRETADSHVFKVDLPGVKKEEIRVEVVDSRVLRISGQRSLERDDTSDTWHRSERSSGSFLRRFTLPENALMDRVRAIMKDGVLTVTVPKKREVAKNPDINSIDVSG